MGLFDFLKKKNEEPKATITVKASVQTADRSHYANTEYAHAVFLQMLSHKPQAVLENPSHYPGYLNYRLGIQDPIGKHNELIKKGYLRKATPMEVIDTYKVPELKKLLEDHGVDPKGRKRVDLLQKIQDNIDVNALELPQLYCVSEKGLAFMAEHDDLIKLFGNNYAIQTSSFLLLGGDCSPLLIR